MATNYMTRAEHVGSPPAAMIVAWYAGPRTVETDDNSGVWDETAGVYYAPEGWYEQSVYGDDERTWRVTDTPTHWAPLPARPLREGA